MNFYDLSVNTPQGRQVPFSEFRGKVVLIVNTATKCGYAPQFRELDTLHQKYKDDGLVVIGFPCNQFLFQEPESNESMEESCRVNFGVTFQLTEKILVNGKNTHPVFNWLKDHLKGKRGKRIQWNFTKFLVTREGIPFRRYEPSTRPSEFEEDIRNLLKAEQ